MILKAAGSTQLGIEKRPRRARELQISYKSMLYKIKEVVVEKVRYRILREKPSMNYAAKSRVTCCWRFFQDTRGRLRTKGCGSTPNSAVGGHRALKTYRGHLASSPSDPDYKIASDGRAAN